MSDDATKKMTVAETMKARHGADYYSRIGARGGAALRTLAANDPSYWKNKGRNGGLAVGAKYGRDYYQAIGKLGGAALKAKVAADPEHFKNMGAKGGRRMAQLVAAGRKQEEDRNGTDG